jgi:hypothetical protein
MVLEQVGVARVGLQVRFALPGACSTHVGHVLLFDDLERLEGTYPAPRCYCIAIERSTR